MSKLIELNVMNYATTASIFKLINEVAAGKVIESITHSKIQRLKVLLF